MLIYIGIMHSISITMMLSYVNLGLDKWVWILGLLAGGIATVICWSLLFYYLAQFFLFKILAVDQDGELN